MILTQKFSNEGEIRRKVGETSLNDQSSRSHTIFKISFEMRDKDKPSFFTIISKILIHCDRQNYFFKS